MDKKKVYLIYCCYGEFEDYNEYLMKAFFDKDKAEKFRNKKESKIEKLKERYKTKCCNCTYGDKYCELYKEPNEQEKYDYDCDCINRVEYYDIYDIQYKLEEIEVE